MSATVAHYERGEARGYVRVKDLGWLLRHASEAHEISTAVANNGDVWLTVWGRSATKHAAEWTYLTPFADFGICMDWLTRPSLTHCTRHVQTQYGLAEIF